MRSVYYRLILAFFKFIPGNKLFNFLHFWILESPHKPLLHKLEAYGVCDELLQWINPFLTDRSFCVKVDQTLSSPAPVHSGVQQWSVLGPLLFLVHINDLTDVISSRSLLHADNLKIWTSDSPDVLQEDIISIKNWSTWWILPINDTKCAHISLEGASGSRFINHDWCCDKWHSYFRPKEGLGCLDHIQPILYTSPRAGCK